MCAPIGDTHNECLGPFQDFTMGNEKEITGKEKNYTHAHTRTGVSRSSLWGKALSQPNALSSSLMEKDAVILNARQAWAVPPISHLSFQP